MSRYKEKVKGKIISIAHEDMSGAVVLTVKRLFFLKKIISMDFRMFNRMLEDMGLHNVSELYGEKVTYEDNQIFFKRDAKTNAISG